MKTSGYINISVALSDEYDSFTSSLLSYYTIICNPESFRTGKEKSMKNEDNSFLSLSERQLGSYASLPFPAASRTRMHDWFLLLLLVEHDGEDIESKLWVFQTHASELVFCTMAQNVALGGPESSNWLPESLVLLARLLVHEARVCDLPFCRRGRAVDLAVSEGLESRDAELVGDGIDFGMSEEGNARVVWGWQCGVNFDARVFGFADAPREIFAFVEVFDERGGGVEVFIREVDEAALWRGRILVRRLLI